MSKKSKEPVYQLTPGKTVQSLLTTARRCGNKAAEANGELGAAIANAVEHKHLHRKAFSVIRQCNKMEPEKLAEFKAHFDHYWTESGLEERADSAERLPIDDPKVANLEDRREAAREAAE